MALFSNQKYESGPKAVIPTYSQVILIKLIGGLSNSSGTLLCLEVLEVPRVAFSSIFTFGGYGWS